MIARVFSAGQTAPRLGLNLVTASLDSRVSLTRSAATATRVNSSGYIEAVAADTPRFDYNPATLACRGLLIEESRTNILYPSATVGGSGVNLVTSTPTATPPDGVSASVSKIAASAVSGSHYLQSSITVTNSTTYTWSLFVKADGINRVNLLMAQSTSPFTNHANITFDLSTATIISTLLGSGTITAYGNGWYRLTVTGTSSSTGELYRVTLHNPGATFTGDGVAGVLLWGQQWEAGGFVTSYIPTTTGTVQRNADVAVMTSTNFSSWWQATRGSVLVRYRPSTVSGTRPVLQFDDNTADNIITLRGNTANPELYIKATTDQAQIDAGTIAANTQYRFAGTWDTNNCAASLNSGTVGTDTAATIPVVTQARLGSDGTNYLNGHLESIEYWAQRLTNATLQSYATSAGYQSIIGPVVQDNIIS